jgi:hypothetical protein
VRKDGTGQFTTINGAKTVATNGDIIEVGPGVYPEEVDFSISVTLVSTDGAAATILDGEGIRRLLIFRTGSSVVDGFTFRRGYQVSSGGGLRVQFGATATVRNCVFENNYVSFDGGAVICRDAGSRLDMFDCVFLSNAAARHAGAALVILDGTASFTRCRFEGNRGPASGAIATDDAAFSVTDCLFIGNTGTISGIWAAGSRTTIVGNTFGANNADGATVYALASYLTFRRNILANDPEAVGLSYDYLYDEDRGCNVYWNNQAPVDGGLNPDEVEADPAFCNAPSGDYTISIHSPAAPANSPCGQLIGAFPTNCDIVPPPPPVIAPVILDIKDVPKDQGLQVRIRWQRAQYDAPGEDYTITGYALYRKQSEEGSVAMPPAAGRGERVPLLDGWDYIETIPARGDDIYQYVAPTLCDTPEGGAPCWSYFFVSAMTPDPLTFFDSAPDSGYSEDNLPPGAPRAFAVEFLGCCAHLTWEAPPDPDIIGYRIYRVTAAQPDPSPATLVHVTAATEWTDSEPVEGARYLLAAVDDAGNEGEIVEPVTLTGSRRIPGQYFLEQNAPNPFNPSTTIEYGVPAGGGRVTIEIFDVAGRRVRTLLDEPRPGGTWRVTWDGTTDAGTHVSSGVYFYRLRAAGFESTRRMTLVE